jgi:sec-independent protein translocase protein TatA
MATGLLTPTHMAILLIVALLVLGPKRLPHAGRALGTSIREFKDAITGHERPVTDTATVADTSGESRPEG